MISNSNDYKQELMDYLRIDITPDKYYQENINVFYFTFIWNLFENHCCQRNANFSKLNKLVSNYSLISNVTSLNEYYRHFKDAFIATEEDSFDFNGRIITFKFVIGTNPDGTPRYNSGCKDAWLLVKNVMNNENSILEEKAEALLYITYRIRNNLFHGEKDPRKIKYQDITFKLANKFLLEITKVVKPVFDNPNY